MASGQFKDSEEKLTFIVGVWRSGTTLLHGLLNQHPEVALMFEAQPFALWPRDGDYVLPKDWPQRLDYLNGTFTRHGLDMATLQGARQLRQACLDLFRAFANRWGARVIGGKSPRYHIWLPEIARIFPEASFVIIWRNPIDCCRSAASIGHLESFFGQRGVLNRTLFGSEALARGVEHLQNLGRRVHQVLFPDLMQDPQRELRQVCDFLGIPFDPKILETKSFDLSNISPGFQPERVHRSRIDSASRRKERFPPELVAKASRYAALWLERFPRLEFARVLTANPGDAKPTTLELMKDRISYRFWLGYDELKRQVLCRIPIPLWGWLRNCIHKDKAPKARPGRRLGRARLPTSEAASRPDRG
jgi:hypothetical protein